MINLMTSWTLYVSCFCCEFMPFVVLRGWRDTRRRMLSLKSKWKILPKGHHLLQNRTAKKSFAIEKRNKRKLFFTNSNHFPEKFSCRRRKNSGHSSASIQFTPRRNKRYRRGRGRKNRTTNDDTDFFDGFQYFRIFHIFIFFLSFFNHLVIRIRDKTIYESVIWRLYTRFKLTYIHANNKEFFKDSHETMIPLLSHYLHSHSPSLRCSLRLHIRNHFGREGVGKVRPNVLLSWVSPVPSRFVSKEEGMEYDMPTP